MTKPAILWRDVHKIVFREEEFIGIPKQVINFLDPKGSDTKQQGGHANKQ